MECARPPKALEAAVTAPGRIIGIMSRRKRRAGYQEMQIARGRQCTSRSRWARTATSGLRA